MADINQKHLDGLKHLDDARNYSRTERGMRLVVGQKPSKLKSWELTYHLFGKKTRFIFGHYPGDFSLAEARIERDRLKSLVRQGTCPKSDAERKLIEKRLAAEQRITFADLRERFDIEHLKKKGRKSRPEILRVLKKEFAIWDRIEPRDLNRQMVVDRLDQIEKRGHVIRNRAHSHLRSMLRFALEKSIVTENVATAISQERETKRQRVLAPDEVRYFWEHIGEQGLNNLTVTALRLILVTGQRGGEILSMKRSDIIGEWWTQPDSKNGRNHRTFLTPTAITLIDDAISQSSNRVYVFGSKQDHIKIGTLSKAILRWQQKPEKPMTIPAFTPHDLRRTMASNLGNMEVSRFAQNQILNHVDNSIGSTYDVSEYDQLKKRTMPLWESRLQYILENHQDDNVIPLRG